VLRDTLHGHKIRFGEYTLKQSFYGRIRAQGYDLGTDQSEIVDYYVSHWEHLGKPSPLLEPMCGTGLNLIPFLALGVPCDGTDSSPYMLEICRMKLLQLGLQSSLHQQALETLELAQRYGFIFIPGGSFGHIYDKQIAATSLKRLYDHLQPGGWLVLDVRPPASIDTFGAPGQVDYDLDDYEDGSTVFTTGYWDHLEDGRVIRKWNKMERFMDNILTETEIFDYRERLYDASEIESDLEQAGFQTIRLTKAYEHATVPGERDGIVCSCQK
jgi:hypothetical protein